MQKKTCFVAMPIRKAGTSEHDHFLTIYNVFFRPPLEEQGYVVDRGDQSIDSGSINRRIIEDLSSADLVVADLTTLNPNVMYEIGIRHTLRKKGTILVFDEKYTGGSVPFDLNDYRYVEYSAEFNRLEEFRTRFTSVLEGLGNSSIQSDNPIHDYIPYLPDNLAISDSDREAQLAEQISKLNSQLQYYRETYGERVTDSRGSAEAIVRARLSKQLSFIRSNNHPSELIKVAQDATSKKDLKALADALERLSTVSEFAPRDRDFFSLSMAIEQSFDDRMLSMSVIELGLISHPESDLLKSRRLANLRQGSVAEQEEAKREIEADLGVTDYGLEALLKKWPAEEGLMLIYFDILSNLGHHQKILEICDLFENSIGKISNIQKERARAFESTEGVEPALALYRDTLGLPDVNDTVCVWYGSTLNNQRRYADASEVYLLACLLDPNDPVNFCHVAQSFSRYFRHFFSLGATGQRKLPKDFGKEEIGLYCNMAYAIGLNHHSARMIEQIAEDISVDPSQMVTQDAGRIYPTEERFRIALDHYRQLRSSASDAFKIEDFAAIARDAGHVYRIAADDNLTR